MIDERIRRRIEALNRGPLPACPERGGAPRITTPTRATASPPMRPGVVSPIPGLMRRGEPVANEMGEHLRIRLALEQLWPRGESLVAKRIQAVSNREGALTDFIAAFPHEVLLLDLETCGLAGAALFLVGLLRNIDGRLTVELLLARDYSEEAAVLTSLWQRVNETTVLATFNGKSFDWPMVLDRTARHRLFRGGKPPAVRQHVDLLHNARRRWKQTLPDCKLQTLETHICGRRRTDDVPGSQIPAAYEQFVRTGYEREMDAILLHNAIDLVTLLDLTMRLVG